MTEQRKNLAAWLAHIEQQHERPIDLGLDRLRVVAHRLGQRQACPLILVGGTNGKGSTCALLERIYLAAGYRVGLYTSPHLLRYNERVRIDGRPATDTALCEGFARVEAARGDVPLTYFEFGTLAAWETFSAAALEVLILEVGLGGRLDAVNLYEPDVSIVTTVDLDHMDYLGPNREAIGFEKAGIFRPGRPAVCGDRQAPESLLDHAVSIGADLQIMGRDFGFTTQEQQWQFWSPRGRRSGLAYPALRGSNQLLNAACVLAAVDALLDRLPVAMQDVRRGLAEVELPGRFQVLPGRPTVVLDVAHNPQAARVLADNLSSQGFYSATWAVFGMLADKDMGGVVAALRDRVTHWLPCSLQGPRAASAEQLAAVLAEAGIAGPLPCFADPALAFRAAKERAGDGDRILAFGSFLTVAQVMQCLDGA